MNKLRILLKGIIKENPVLVLMLGTCPTLATTTSAINGLGMGIAATVVLICSNIVISILKNVIPDKVRIPCYIVVIAGFVSVVQMLLKAYLPALDKSLGLFIPLIVVNCIILGRAEMFANKNSVIDSALDGVGMGIGFTLTLGVMGLIREFLGSGTLFDHAVMPDVVTPMVVFMLPAGGFFVFAILVALVNYFSAKKGGAAPKKEFGCGACPMAEACAKTSCDDQDPAKVEAIKAATKKETEEQGDKA